MRHNCHWRHTEGDRLPDRYYRYWPVMQSPHRQQIRESARYRHYQAPAGSPGFRAATPHQKSDGAVLSSRLLPQWYYFEWCSPRPAGCRQTGAVQPRGGCWHFGKDLWRHSKPGSRSGRSSSPPAYFRSLPEKTDWQRWQPAPGPLYSPVAEDRSAGR